jgi:hypothetical protein
MAGTAAGEQTTRRLNVELRGRLFSTGSRNTSRRKSGQEVVHPYASNGGGAFAKRLAKPMGRHGCQ